MTLKNINCLSLNILEMTFPYQEGQQALTGKQRGERRDGHGMFLYYNNHHQCLNSLQAVAARKIGKEIKIKSSDLMIF